MITLAHGIGGRTDLPLPLWMFGYGSAAVLVLSFVALGILWRESKLEAEDGGPSEQLSAAHRHTPLELVGRALGLLAFVVVLLASFLGPPEAAENVTPYAIFIGLWVGVALVSSIGGDIWRVISPLDSLALIGERLGVARAGADASQTAGWAPAALIFGFVWLELVYPYGSDPRHLGLLVIGYTIAALVVAVRAGRDGLRRWDCFAVYFWLLSLMAPLVVEDGRARIRPPFVRLARLDASPGTVALVLVVLGSTAFDGITRTRQWIELVSPYDTWPAAAVSTVGLVWAVAVITTLYVGAVAIAGFLTKQATADLVPAFAHSLVPIALAYGIAHYFSLLLFEGQAGLSRLSDPFDKGWDLFGTADWTVNFLLLSPGAIAWVQAISIVGGHVAGVVLAHDRALALMPHREATRSQYPLLGAMVCFTVGGLALLLGG